MSSQKCWQCGKKLVLLHFAQIHLDDGTVLNVHKVCKKNALAALGMAIVITQAIPGHIEPKPDSDDL